MATDWSARDAALPYFEKHLKWAKQEGDSNVPLIEAAVHALKRSQDHTALQTRLNTALETLRDCDEYLSRSTAEAIHAGSNLHKCIKNALGKSV